MKYLLIGIDGCHEELFSRFEMPFMQEMIAQGKKVNLTEDLISRGWTEICTGMHATECGGYYERPVMNKTHEWSISYNLLKEKNSNLEIQTIWDYLNGHGFSVGIMNVPTTNPAPKVDGFFVSGGGGGRTVSDVVDVDQCYPLSIKQILEDLNYIVDERVPSLLFEKKLYDEKDFFARLKLMNEKRVESYIALNQQFDVDFGFIVFRSMVVVEFLAAAEIERYLDGDTSSVNIKLIDNIKDFYNHLDMCIDRLCADIAPEKLGLVSDHGMVPQKFSVNLNAFLQVAGFQQPAQSKNGLLSQLKRYKNILPHSFRKWLKNKPNIAQEYAKITNFDKKSSVAFSINKTSSFFGIYINDSDRFGGNIKPEDIADIAADVVEKFNNYEEAIKHGFLAVKETGRFKGKYAKYWPDVRVIVPDGYSPWEHGNAFVSKLNRSEKRINLKDVKEDLWTGTRSAKPLSTFVNHSCLDPNRYDGENLSSVFEIIKHELNHENCTYNHPLGK